MVLGKRPVALVGVFSLLTIKAHRNRTEISNGLVGVIDELSRQRESSGRNTRGRDLDSQSWVWITVDRDG